MESNQVPESVATDPNVIRAIAAVERAREAIGQARDAYHVSEIHLRTVIDNAWRQVAKQKEAVADFLSTAHGSIIAADLLDRTL